MKARLEREGEAATLRPEKNTRPRMTFAVDGNHPIDAWEPKVPREGASYHNDAYSVYSWGEPGFDGEGAQNGEEEAR